MADLITPRRGEYFDSNGNPTLRFIKWVEGFSEQSNATTTEINNIFTGGFSAQVQQIRKELDGLSEFTMDTTGFTMDQTSWTMDKVVA